VQSTYTPGGRMNNFAHFHLVHLCQLLRFRETVNISLVGTKGILSISYACHLFLCDGCVFSLTNTLFQTATETGQHMHRYQVPGTATSMAWHPNLTQHVLASAGGERKGTGWISLFGA
jgi:hypothetical protein